MTRWGMGAFAAVVMAILSLLTVAGAGQTRVEMELSLEGVTLSATTQSVRVELKL